MDLCEGSCQLDHVLYCCVVSHNAYNYKRRPMRVFDGRFVTSAALTSGHRNQDFRDLHDSCTADGMRALPC